MKTISTVFLFIFAESLFSVILSYCSFSLIFTLLQREKGRHTKMGGWVGGQRGGKDLGQKKDQNTLYKIFLRKKVPLLTNIAFLLCEILVFAS